MNVDYGVTRNHIIIIDKLKLARLVKLHVRIYSVFNYIGKTKYFERTLYCTSLGYSENLLNNMCQFVWIYLVNVSKLYHVREI